MIENIEDIIIIFLTISMKRKTSFEKWKNDEIFREHIYFEFVNKTLTNSKDQKNHQKYFFTIRKSHQKSRIYWFQLFKFKIAIHHKISLNFEI